MQRTMLTIRCTSDGRPASRMWTEGKTYTATVCGHNGCQLVVVDDLGHERVMGNDGAPSFPMGTAHAYQSEPFRACFERCLIEPNNRRNRYRRKVAAVRAYGWRPPTFREWLRGSPPDSYTAGPAACRQTFRELLQDAGPRPRLSIFGTKD